MIGAIFGHLNSEHAKRKATTEYNLIFEVQVLTYLRLTGCHLGLVINFGKKRVVDGFRRVVNGL